MYHDFDIFIPQPDRLESFTSICRYFSESFLAVLLAFGSVRSDLLVVS